MFKLKTYAIFVYTEILVLFMLVSCINNKLIVCISYQKLDMKKKIVEEKVIEKRMTRSQKEILDEGTRSKKKEEKLRERIVQKLLVQKK